MTRLFLLGAGLLAATSGAAFGQSSPTTPGGTTYPTRPTSTTTPDSSVTNPDTPMPPDSSGTRITPDGTRSADPNNANGPVAASDPKAKDHKQKNRPQ